ncbi:MAG: Rad52/Rad22 family DNA repair protein [Chloroflexota bacterium]|nr:Rad52/Rad22 family DNA repair protein [Chloroflexota bacterium]
MTEQVIDYGSELDVNFLPQDVIDKLNEELDTKLIKSYEGPGNRTLHYIEAHAVIANANRIFGPANWSSRVLEGPTLHRIEITNWHTGQITAVHEYYTALVGVYVYGRFISSDEGFGEVDEIKQGTKTKMMLGMHEKARKGAISDGIKRAMRVLGPQFGNSLYGDGELATGGTGYASGPACPAHGAGPHIKKSQWGEGYFCTMKDPSTESGYCDRTPIDPDAKDTTGEPAAYVAPAYSAPAYDASRSNQPAAQGYAPQGYAAQGYAQQGYGQQGENGNAHATPSASPSPTAVYSDAGPAQASGGRSLEELKNTYVSLGEGRGMNKGQIFTLFMRQYGKPISQATAGELEALIASAQQTSQ